MRCDKCGSRLILVWVGDKIPWYACPICDRGELNNAQNHKKEEVS